MLFGLRIGGAGRMLAHDGGMSWSDVAALWAWWGVDERVVHPLGQHNLVQAGFGRRSSMAGLVFGSACLRPLAVSQRWGGFIADWPKVSVGFIWFSVLEQDWLEVSCVCWVLLVVADQEVDMGEVSLLPLW